jgi:hypothetical protein
MSSVHNPYISEPCNPFGVPLPPTFESQLTGKKLARINDIQLEHARIVAESLAKSYSEIMAVIGAREE